MKKIYILSLIFVAVCIADLSAYDHRYAGQNFPNPFNPTTTISYSLPQSGDVRLVVSDYLGREVAVLADRYKAAGKYDVQFDASKLTSGVYFYSIRSGNYTAVKRMMLLK